MTPDDDRRAPSGGSRPVPDPTVLTDAAIGKAVDALTDYINGQLAVRDERLRGIDEATKLRLESVTSMPAAIEASVGRLRDVTNEKFSSIEVRFSERDTRSENEKRDSKVAVDAAFAAQKEAAAQRDLANAEAIGKSERATAETIKTNQELNTTKTEALAKTLDEVKGDVVRIQSTRLGQIETRKEGTDNRTAIYATVSVVATVVFLTIAVLGFLATQVPRVAP